MLQRRYGPQKEKSRRPAKKEFIETFQILERQLGDHPYFRGDRFGFVDLSIITLYSLFYAYETFGNFSIEAECPKILLHELRGASRRSL